MTEEDTTSGNIEGQGETSAPPSEDGFHWDAPTAQAPDELLDVLRRVQADFANYKRRADEERQELQRHANSRLILKLLPVFDEFVLAIQHASKDGPEPSWLEGIALIQRKLNALLESEKVVKIEALGREFDPFEHEAMAYQESPDHPEGCVISVVREGYRLDERVLRPALVVLAKRPERDTRSSDTVSEKEFEDA
ncbi:MAG: nucleotide exchange factor GrpE [Dehalococcoidia bacterium]|nr:nucleotide exchange factor GrpE [Dehalococcoidia bacterium]